MTFSIWFKISSTKGSNWILTMCIEQKCKYYQNWFIEWKFLKWNFSEKKRFQLITKGKFENTSNTHSLQFLVSLFACKFISCYYFSCFCFVSFHTRSSHVIISFDIGWLCRCFCSYLFYLTLSKPVARRILFKSSSIQRIVS